jgi:hypothetical protein
MVMLSFDFEGKKYQAKIIHSQRNGRSYYWVDILDKIVTRKLGQSFTFISNDKYDLSSLTPVTTENKRVIGFFRRKIIQMFLHNNLPLSDQRLYQS